MRFEQGKSISKEAKEILKGQGRNLSNILYHLNLSQFKVSNSLEFRDPGLFENSLQFAMSGFEEGPIAVMAAAQRSFGIKSGRRIIPLLLNPVGESALFTDQNGERSWTNSFYICEGNVFKPIMTFQPIPIDGFDPMFSQKNAIRGFDAYPRAYDRLQKFTRDKWKSRLLMEKYGILMPPAKIIFKGQSGLLEEEISSFVQSTATQGLVVKGNGGYGGILVKMFGVNDLENAQIFGEKLFKRGYDVILEKRIIPIDSKAQMSVVSSDNFDVNFRTLVSLGRIRKCFGAELRGDYFSEKPVNIHQGARALSVEHLPPEVHDFLARRSEYISLILSLSAGDISELLGFLGSDEIIGDDENLYTIEANAGNVGGLGTLARLRGKPLEGVGETYVPSLEPFLLKRFKRRVSGENLSHLGLDSQDEKYIQKAFELARINVPWEITKYISQGIFSLFSKNKHSTGGLRVNHL